MENLKLAEEQERKDIQLIKETVELKKDEIISFILDNITQVELQLPEVMKKRPKKPLKK